MQKTIHISGAIGNILDAETVYTVKDLVADIKEGREEGATSFKFFIDSEGGYVNEGFQMAAIIEGMNEPTIAVATRVCSIANIIYFSCDDRQSDSYSMFMLHQAIGGIEGNSDDMRRVADLLDKENERIANYISRRTNIEKDHILALMSEDRFIDEVEAERLGFFTSMPKLKAVALYNKAINPQTKNTVMAGVKEAWATITQALGVEPKNMGDKEKEEPKAMLPDGKHKLENGTTIVIEGGSIIETIESEAVDMEDGKAMDAEKDEIIAELQAKVQAMEEEKRAMSEEKEGAMNKYTELESKVTNLAKKLEDAERLSSNAKAPSKHERYTNKAPQPAPIENGNPNLVGADKFRAERNK